jgi:hypothetical protein
MLERLWDWWYGLPEESDYILVLGSLIADIELSNAFDEDIEDRVRIASELCSSIQRWYLLEDLGDWDNWNGPSGPMEVTYRRQRIIERYGIVYRYPQLVLRYSYSWLSWVNPLNGLYLGVEAP